MNDDTSVGCLLLVVLLIFSFGFGCFWNYVLVENQTIVVTDKNNVVDKHGQYLVFTKGEVFVNADTWYRLKVSSSDYQNDLKIGKTYEVTVVGMRVPLFSWYRNIVNYKLVD